MPDTTERLPGLWGYRCCTCAGTGIDSDNQTCRDCSGTGMDNHPVD